MSSRYSAEQIIDAVRAIFLAKGSERERLHLAIAELNNANKECYRSDFSNELWKELQELLYDGSRIEERQDFELREYAYQIVEFALQYEREDAIRNR